MTSDHESYRQQIDWPKVLKYKKENQLKLGLTASLEEYGNTPLKERLQWAEKNRVDFFYSFRNDEYIKTRMLDAVCRVVVPFAYHAPAT